MTTLFEGFFGNKSRAPQKILSVSNQCKDQLNNMIHIRDKHDWYNVIQKNLCEYRTLSFLRDSNSDNWWELSYFKFAEPEKFINQMDGTLERIYFKYGNQRTCHNGFHFDNQTNPYLDMCNAFGKVAVDNYRYYIPLNWLPYADKDLDDNYYDNVCTHLALRSIGFVIVVLPYTISRITDAMLHESSFSIFEDDKLITEYYPEKFGGIIRHYNVIGLFTGEIVFQQIMNTCKYAQKHIYCKSWMHYQYYM